MAEVSSPVRTVRLGTATVTVFNVGDVEERFRLEIPEAERTAETGNAYKQTGVFPFQCAHIAVPGASVLVDAFDYTTILSAYEFHPPAGYTPPSDLLTQMRQAGIDPASVTHVVITHAHFDHYSGVTTQRDGHAELAFPNARCYAGRADWDGPAGQELIAGDAKSTMGVLFARDLVTLVEGDSELVPGVRLLASPGESPGHLTVRAQAGGPPLYCLGDLLHFPIEVEHPSWRVSWADADQILASRRALFDAALAEDALLVAGHIAGVGRLERTSTGVRWVEA